jgi:hypothetical protein
MASEKVTIRFNNVINLVLLYKGNHYTMISP